METKKSQNLIYRNDFNTIPMPDLNSRQMDIFMKVLYELYNRETREIKLNAHEFFKNIKKEQHRKKLMGLFKGFADKILNFNLKFEEGNQLIAFVCIEKCVWDLETNTLEFTAQKDFYELLMDRKKTYTMLNLEEYWGLKSEYAKRLYPLLMQFENAKPNEDGEQELIINWDDFKAKLHIPKHYKSHEIDKWVIQKAIDDLTKERDLFSGNRPAFKGLKVKEKFYKKGFAGRPIERIKFTWISQKEIRKADKIKAKTAKLAQSNEYEMLKKWQRGEFDSYKFKYTKPHPNFDKLGIFRLGKYDFKEKAFVVVFHSIDNPANSQTMTFQKGLTQFKDAFKDFEIVE